MPPVGKEIEHQNIVDEVAVREVEGYIDRIERQVEVPQDTQTRPQVPQVQTQALPQDMGKVVSAQFAVAGKANITLPLSKDEIETGLKARVVDGIKWLSEWCVYMIKKYPGRVFYSPPSSNQ